jgi:hypothetical protein
MEMRSVACNLFREMREEAIQKGKPLVIFGE